MISTMVLKYLKIPILSLVLGLAFVGYLSWQQSHSTGQILQSVLTVLLLCILEISLSFDNAVVNASVLRRMSDVWQRRFLFWGILIAVFGMRLLFPLVIVSVVGGFSLFESFMMALREPDRYSEMMKASHLAVASFGGSFLMMVAMHFFYNEEKEIHWIPVIEKPFARASKFRSIELLLGLGFLIGIHFFLPPNLQHTFIISGIWGIVVFMLVHGLSDLLEKASLANVKWLSSGFGLFMYLEVLDASFSFDGVVGAFAITHRLIEILIGLGVGAFFVRSLTIYLVEQETLEQFKFLEHGAFYALTALAMFMLFDHFFHFPEWLTALTGAAILTISIFWSIYEDRKSRTH